MPDKVDFDIEGALEAAQSAAERALLTLAARIEERAKANIVGNDQVDTGFMLNSIYVTSRKHGSGYGEARADAESCQVSEKTDRLVDHSEDMDAEVDPAEFGADVSIVVGANYAIYQEMANPFLRPAVSAARAEVEDAFGVAFRMEGF